MRSDPIRSDELTSHVPEDDEYISLEFSKRAMLRLGRFYILEKQWKHASHLENVFAMMKNNKLRLSIKKRSFIQPSVEVLGRIVDKNGVHFDEQKVKTSRDATSTTTGKELRSFSWLASYYHRFMPGFGRIASPLNAKASDKIKVV